MRRRHLAPLLQITMLVALVASLAGVAVMAAPPALVSAAPPSPMVRAKPRDLMPRFRDGYVLVAFKKGVRTRYVHGLEQLAQAIEVRTLGVGVHLLKVPSGQVLSVVRLLNSSPGVRYAEPDYVSELAATPNDPSFPIQWGYQNTGQTVNGTAGTPYDDERAVPAWDVTTGSRSIVIGEVDTGAQYTHPDLAANIWTNPGGIGGCPAGTHGYNVLTSTCDPMDDDTQYGGHGTHVAGIMGAVGNNGIGVTGVNWQTTILPVKWVSSNGGNATSDLITALDWLIQAKQAGVNIRVINDSTVFVGTAYSQALSDEITSLGQNNILFVTAAGNTGDDNDNPAVRRYPCGYDLSNEICVAASDQNDALPSWANYGPTTVDLAAPGNNIYSTLLGSTYGFINGSSMASPQVAGAAALILSVKDMTATQLKADIFENVDVVPGLNGLVRTGGRLDICKALPGCVMPTLPPPAVGLTSVGSNSDVMVANRERVNHYQLATAGTISKLTMYLQPTGTSGQQAIEGLLYADQSGTPGALVATTNPITFSSTETAGWYDLTFASPVAVNAGTYWIGVMSGNTSKVAGFRWNSVSGIRAIKTNTYANGPSNPFGSASIDSEQMSLYATYTPNQTSAPLVPFSVTPPAIQGTPGQAEPIIPQVGQTLTATTGTWDFNPTSYAYQWSRCSGTGSSCAPISGATSSTYVPVNADATGTLQVRVSATNSNGTASASSSPSQIVTGATSSAPANQTLPTISGTAQAGQTLTATSGTWTNNPTSYAYQWARCDTTGANCVAISGATATTYTLASADVGSTVLVAVTATNSAGSGSADSAPTAVVQAAAGSAPANSALPTITGTAQAGQTLTATNGTWTNNPTSYAYQWQRCNSSGASCAPISGATGSTYALGSADVGTTLIVTVTATNAAGSGTASSAATGVVQAAAAGTFGKTNIGAYADTSGSNAERVDVYSVSQSVSVTKLTIYLLNNSSGQQVLEGVIYADQGGTPGALLGVTNQLTFSSSESSGWYDMPFASPVNILAGNYWIGLIDGPTANVFALAYDWGATNSSDLIRPSYSSGPPNPFGSGSLSSENISIYATYTQPQATNPPTNSALPTISGTAQAGQTLTATSGTWTNNPLSYAYQWQRCNSSGASCTAISGATNTTYTLASADVGSTVVVSVTATNTAGSATASSAATAVVQPVSAPVNSTLPTITGTAQSGQTLTASSGTWTNNPTSYAYQWQRCNTSGASCTAISGATASSYTLASADIGTTLVVSVTATNAGGSASASSTATGVVQLAPTGTFGKTTIGAYGDPSGSNAERVEVFSLSQAAGVTKLTIYLIDYGSGQQVLKGLIYSDQGGTPGALLGTTNEFTFNSSSDASGWYDLTFAAPVELSAGNYWIGLIDGPTASIFALAYDWGAANSSDLIRPTYSSGPPNPFGSGSLDSEDISIYATYTQPQPMSPPANSALPTVSGTAQAGQTLTATTGTWTNSPTAYSYQWERCNTSGASCAAISGATSSTYAAASADVGSTLVASVTAANAGGSTTASSAATAVVQAASSGGTFGQTSIGPYTDSSGSNAERVEYFSVGQSVSVTKLTIYLMPYGSGQQVLEGVIYSDQNGTPNALLGVTNQFTFSTSSDGSGWYDLTFASPIALSAGNYWIGLIDGNSANVFALAYTWGPSNCSDLIRPSYSSGPPNPFGSGTLDSEQISIYATYS